MDSYRFQETFLESPPEAEKKTDGEPVLPQDEPDLFSERETRAEGCFRLVLIQTALFTVLLLTAFLLRTVAPKAYARFHGGYFAAVTEKDIAWTDVQGFFYNIGRFLFSSPSENAGSASSGAAGAESEGVSGTKEPAAPGTADGMEEGGSDEAESIKTTGETGNDELGANREEKSVTKAGKANKLVQKAADKSAPYQGGMGGEDGAAMKRVSLNAYLLTVPIHAPTRGSVTSAFGQRVHPLTGKSSFHTGLDIANAVGTPIYAAFCGEVEMVGQDAVYGNFVLLRHSDGLKTFYGHCERVQARSGMRLRAGEIIGFMGSTGWSTGPHLHFEIQIDNRRVDPAYALRGLEQIAV